MAKPEEESNRELNECRIHAIQLERAIQYLHNKIEELQFECDHLNNEIDKKTEQLNCKSKIIEKKLNENEELQEELFALKAQFETLKEMIAEANARRTKVENILSEKDNQIAVSLEKRISALENCIEKRSSKDKNQSPLFQ